MPIHCSKRLSLLLWSDHGTNFVGANRELKEFSQFLKSQITQGNVSEFCSTKNIEWKFIPEHSPHFGGLWESTVKSAKTYLREIVGTVKLTFEYVTTILTQVEAYLNSRPLVSISSHSDDGIEVLTSAHFLIGRPLTALPDSRGLLLLNLTATQMASMPEPGSPLLEQMVS